MKDELITLETAKLAREKGFDLKTTYCWWAHVDYVGEYKLSTNNRNYENYNARGPSKHFPQVDYSAPTQSLLQRWLRETHGKNIEIMPGANIGKYCVFMSGSRHGYIFESGNKVKNFDSYEEALEAALQETLKSL